ncbi:IPExxxVDY family protein [Parapedobacter tibetensis]|uniref:IPExxxVDY family protein n=1 Tax=Parapedobacter tibetensis TaxID=2972951 RepID=UPI00214D5D20|nr:IPExxxVDY family protein [Parapedobacter tibetensis]
MNKVILKYELDLDFILIAITSSLKDYRLCYFINKFTGLKLHKIDDHEIWKPSPKSRVYFSRYADYSAPSDTEYYLLANKGADGGFLIPEMRHSDYFFLIKNFIDDEDLTALQDNVAEIPEVVVASEIPPQKLKSKENLIF